MCVLWYTNDMCGSWECHVSGKQVEDRLCFLYIKLKQLLLINLIKWLDESKKNLKGLLREQNCHLN